MRAHYLQHVPFEGLGSIENWLRQAGYDISCTRFYESEPLPPVSDVDLLVVMGGPMSVHDEDRYPWLVLEKAFIKAFIDSGKPVLGVCLGAQLIATVAGGSVKTNKEKEIGWFPIRSVVRSEEDDFVFPENVEVFHWHGETFDLPPGAKRLAESVACKNQAFQLGSSVIGLQFHLESTPNSVKQLVSNCRDELVFAPFVQSEEEILSKAKADYAAINRLMGDVLSFLLRG